MKILKKIFFVIFTIGSFTSCTPIMKMFYGIKTPRVENYATLTHYLNKLEIDTSAILIPEASHQINKVLLEFGKSVPQAVMFDTKGNRITYKSSEQDCNAGLFATIPQLDKTSQLKPEEGKNLNEFIQNLTFLSNGKKLKDVSKADYYLFISWGKYAGKLNKDHVREWIRLAKENKNVAIKVYKVNLDFQENWGLQLGKKIK